MNFINELKWRGMLHDVTPGAEESISKEMQVGYIGFDPTAPSLTIGNYVQIMLLAHWQRTGNKPIVLMGGATGRIGDPSGKDAERSLKSYEEIDANLDKQKKLFYKFLNFEDGDNKAIIINNLDFYKNMDVLDFLRNVGKTLTVNYMMSKDSVKNRLETGISFTEFSYQLLQAYDFQCLYGQNNCKFQMGGSDQWGNITSGIEFIRRNLTDAKAYAVTTPLLTRADGKKFGKSDGNNIWLSKELTSPYKFYQFWINTSDDDLAKMFRYFSFKSREEIESLELEHASNPNALKQTLAEEMTIRVHSKEDFLSVQNVSQILFNKKLDHSELITMNNDSFENVKAEIPSFNINSFITGNDGFILIDVLTEIELLSSKSDGRRAIQNNALAVNKIKVDSIEHTVNVSDFINKQYILVENGKKNKYLLFLN